MTQRTRVKRVERKVNPSGETRLKTISTLGELMLAVSQGRTDYKLSKELEELSRKASELGGGEC